MFLRTVEISSFLWDWSSRYKAVIAGSLCEDAGNREANFSRGSDVGSGAGGRRKEVRICDSVGGIMMRFGQKEMGIGIQKWSDSIVAIELLLGINLSIERNNRQ